MRRGSSSCCRSAAGTAIRGERHPGHHVRNHRLGLRAARLDPRRHDVRHAPRRLRQSGVRRQADGDGGPYRSRPVRAQRRLGLESDRVRHDGRAARRSRRSLRLCGRVAQYRQSRLVGGPAVRFPRPPLQAEGRARQAQAVVGQPADTGQCRQFRSRPGFCRAQFRLPVHDGAAERPGSARQAQVFPRCRACRSIAQHLRQLPPHGPRSRSEAQEYHHYIVHEQGDWEAADYAFNLRPSTPGSRPTRTGSRNA